MAKTVALIPARGGSKSIPLKNIKKICGKPLIYWTTKAACEADCVDRVYIATDNKDIREVVRDFKEKEKPLFNKVHLIDRSAQNASDIASTEAVMLEFAEKVQFDSIILIQATSPMLQGKDIEKGYALFMEKDTDSVLSVVEQKRFIWKADNNGSAIPINYDVFSRPRRQDFAGYLLENGAFYITSRKALLNSKNRISGNIKVYKMSEDNAYEIDEPNDFLIIETLLTKRINDCKSICKRPIKMVVTDVDGCLTDGGMYYSEKGDELKKFNTKDGMAIARIHEKGMIVGIITGEKMYLNKKRAEKLKVDFIKQGVKDKLYVLEQLCKRYSVDLMEVLYVGDDINDLEVMKAVGYSACPADASYDIQAVADYISIKAGGHGAVGDILGRFIISKYIE